MDTEDRDYFEEIIGGDENDPNQNEGGEDTTASNEEETETGVLEETEEDSSKDVDDSGDNKDTSSNGSNDKNQEPSTDDTEDIDDTDDIDDPQLVLQRYKTLQGMYRSQKEKFEELSKKLEKVSVPDKEESDTKQDTSNSTEDATTSIPEDIDMSWVSESLRENSKITEVEDDLPEVVSLVEESLKSVLKKYTLAVGQAMQTMSQQIQEKVAPIEQTIGQTIQEKKQAKISEVHPDYDKYLSSQEVQDWIDSKPTRIKKAYEEIIKEGEAEEVIEMLNDFKQETNIATKQKQAKKKIPKTISTKTKAPSSGKVVDMDNFEQAFEEAVQEE